MQDCTVFIASAVQMLQPCTKLSIRYFIKHLTDNDRTNTSLCNQYKNPYAAFKGDPWNAYYEYMYQVCRTLTMLKLGSIILGKAPNPHGTIMEKLQLGGTKLRLERVVYWLFVKAGCQWSMGSLVAQHRPGRYTPAVGCADKMDVTEEIPWGQTVLVL